ncbi:NmrA family NAD(P)-binding protein [Streptomyces sp. OZ13]|jgi:uncharacterized protein YbjT (DUF2867 family)|uniref:NmrA family NAD(P)-binding protein n=1 Tax=Streptomyces sp. OZ13 TaxID=3452210 RepID=UPI003F892D34
MTPDAVTADTRPTLVTGGTGKTGRRVAERLSLRGLRPRTGSRTGTPPFDWNAPATWDAALDGMGSVYLSYYPDLAFPGAADTVGAFCRTAVAAGVRRIVLLSGIGEEGARAAEDQLKASGAEWTVVRSNWFDQNFSECFFLPPVLAGELAVPAADTVAPFVDADDVADVAVAALTDPAHTGRTYELSGPRLLSFADIADELSKATGRTITYRPVTVEEYRTILEDAGQDQTYADVFAVFLDGRNAHLVDGVRQVLGREPRDFTDFARETAATGVWTP